MFLPEKHLGTLTYVSSQQQLAVLLQVNWSIVLFVAPFAELFVIKLTGNSQSTLSNQFISQSVYYYHPHIYNYI